MKLTYSEIVRILAGFNWISDQGSGAFKARLRKLQGEGVPVGSNPGKGKRVEYTLPMIVEALLACELLQCGLSPQEAAQMVKANRADFYLASLLAIFVVKTPERDPMILINPESFRENTNNANFGGAGELGSVTFVSRARFLELFSKRKPFEPVTGEPWRWAMIDLGLLMYTFMSALESPERSPDAVMTALLDEVQDNLPAIKEFAEERLNSIVEFFGSDEDDG